MEASAVTAAPAAINALGQVFGVSGVVGSFLRYSGHATRLDIFTDESFALNDRGQLVGNNSAGAVPITAPPGNKTVNGTRLIPLPGAKKDQYGVRYGAVALNERNQIVGWSSAKTSASHAVVWTLKRG